MTITRYQPGKRLAAAVKHNNTLYLAGQVGSTQIGANDARIVARRDPILAPLENVHATIENGDTALGESGLLFEDGCLWLDWQWRPAAPR